MSLKQLAPINHRQYLQNELDDNSILEQSVSKIYYDNSLKHPDPVNSLTGSSLMNPKREIICTIIGQHQTGRGLQGAFKIFQEEMNENLEVTTHETRHLEEKLNIMTAQILGAFHDGDDRTFFQLRENMLDELNYYKRDFKSNLEIEVMVRIYFALYYLLPNSFSASMILEDSLEKTKKRLTALKRYFGENGGLLSKNEIFQKYLKVPYVNLEKTSPFENEDLKEILTKEFCTEVQEKITNEVRKVIFFIKEVSTSRSFLTRIYEFYISTNTDPETNIHEHAYQQIKQNQSDMEDENHTLNDEINEAHELKGKLRDKYDGLKNDFMAYMIEQKKARSKKLQQKSLKQENLNQNIQSGPYCLKHSNQAESNEHWLSKHDLLVKLSRDYMNLIRQKKNGIPIEQSHINILSNKLRKLKQEICNPQLIDKVYVNNQVELKIPRPNIMDLSKPYFLVLGAPKSGKSTLQNFLLGNNYSQTQSPNKRDTLENKSTDNFEIAHYCNDTMGIIEIQGFNKNVLGKPIDLFNQLQQFINREDTKINGIIIVESAIMINKIMKGEFGKNNNISIEENHEYFWSNIILELVKYFLTFKKEADHKNKIEVTNVLDNFSFVVSNADKLIMKDGSKEIDTEKLKSLVDLIKFYIEWLESKHDIHIRQERLAFVGLDTTKSSLDDSDVLNTGENLKEMNKEILLQDVTVSFNKKDVVKQASCLYESVTNSNFSDEQNMYAPNVVQSFIGNLLNEDLLEKIDSTFIFDKKLSEVTEQEEEEIEVYIFEILIKELLLMPDVDKIKFNTEELTDRKINDIKKKLTDVREKHSKVLQNWKLAFNPNERQKYNQDVAITLGMFIETLAKI